jgi:hypothetical protein
MNGYNIGYTGSIRLYNNDPNLNSNYLELDQFGNLVLNNTTNDVYISNPLNSVGGAIDMFVNWDGANYGSELFLNNTVAQITTNSGTNTWTFDDNGNLTLPVGAGNNTNISTPLGVTGTINIYNYKGDGTNDISGDILLDSTSITLSTNNGANNMTLDENGTLEIPSNLSMNNADIVGVSNIYSTSTSVDIYYSLGGGISKGSEILLDVTNDSANIITNDGANKWTFDVNGVLTLPIGATGASYINTSDSFNVNANGNILTLDQEGKLIVPTNLYANAIKTNNGIDVLDTIIDMTTDDNITLVANNFIILDTQTLCTQPFTLGGQLLDYLSNSGTSGQVLTSTGIGVEWTDGTGAVDTTYAVLEGLNSLTGILSASTLSFINPISGGDILTSNSQITFNASGKYYLNATFSGVSNVPATALTIQLNTSAGTFYGNTTASVSTAIVNPFTINISGIYTPALPTASVITFTIDLSFAIITFTSAVCSVYKI